jgi:2-octaprenyl-6-methoxyphenol hydroxylase
MQSSLVWVETPEEARALMDLDEAPFMRRLEERLQGLLGAITSIGPRASFPLVRMTANHLGARRIALIGEAAHVIPPIGAQGLNLGLRDIATLVELVTRSRQLGADVGGDGVLSAYDTERRSDIATRATMVDTLNRSLISDFLPLHLVRGAGLHALNTLPWLRRLVMREGLHPSGRLPELMRS